MNPEPTGGGGAVERLKVCLLNLDLDPRCSRQASRLEDSTLITSLRRDRQWLSLHDHQVPYPDLRKHAADQ